MKYPVLTAEERRQRLEPPRKKIHAVIDSDTYNEVDDQFAIWKMFMQHRSHLTFLHA